MDNLGLDLEKLARAWELEGQAGLLSALNTEKSPAGEALKEILQEFSSLLEEYPEQLPAQLHARNRAPDSESGKELTKFIELLIKKTPGPWLKTRSPLPPPDKAYLKSFDEHYDFVGKLEFLGDDMFVSCSEDGNLILRNVLADSDDEPLKIIENDNPVNYVSLAPDGKQLISADDDYKVKIRDPGTLETLATFSGHEDNCSKAIATGTDKIVSISADQTLRVWDQGSGETLHVLEGHNAWVYALAVSPDGTKAISASLNSTMIVWDLESGERVKTIIDGGDDVISIMGMYIGGSNDSDVGHKSSPGSILWLPDGRIISASEEIIIWNDTDFTETMRLTGSPWDIKAMALFDNNRKLATVAHSVKIWDLEEGRELVGFIGHDDDEIYSVAIDPLERFLVTADKNGLIKVWDLPMLMKGNRVSGHTGYADTILTSPDGKLVATGGYDKSAVLWNPADGQPLFHLKDHAGTKVVPQGFRKRGAELITSSSGQLRIWNTATGEHIKDIVYENDLVEMEEGVFLDDGKRFIGGSLSYKPVLWDIDEDNAITLDSPFAFHNEMALSEDQNFVLSGSYPGKTLNDNENDDWNDDDDDDEDEEEDVDNSEDSEDSEDNNENNEEEDDDDFDINALENSTFSADEFERDADDYGNDEDEDNEPRSSPAALWDVRAGKIVREFWLDEDSAKLTDESDSIYPTCVSFYKNDTQALTGWSNGQVRIFDRESGEILKGFTLSDDYIDSMSLLENGRLVAAGPGGNFLNVYDLESETLSASSPARPIFSVELRTNIRNFSQGPGENRFTVTLIDDSINLVDLEKGQVLSTLHFMDSIRDLEVDGDSILVCTEAGFLHALGVSDE